MLERKIDRAIEKEAIKTGKMGTELVTVEMALTSGEIEEFRNLEKYDSDHYFGKSRVTPLEFPIQKKFKKTPGTVLEIVLNKCKF